MHLMIKPERVRQLSSEWFVTRHTARVEFREGTQPENDPQDDYLIAYEAVFEPGSLDQARVELWVTPDGYIAIGFERWKRIAERLDIKCGNNRFAAGHEPQCMSESGLLAILDLIADGQIAISSSVIPLFGLVSTKAVVCHGILDELVSKGYSPTNWLKGVSQKKFSTHLLQYRQWE